MKEKRIKLAWICDKCHWLTVSDSLEHHQMDFCKCENPTHISGVDLESYSCRYAGYPRVIARWEEGGKWKNVRQKRPKESKTR